MNKMHLWTSIAIVCGATGCASGATEDAEQLGSTATAIEAASCHAWLSGSVGNAEGKGIGPSGSIEAELTTANRRVGMVYAEYAAFQDSPLEGTISGKFDADDHQGSVEGWYEPRGASSAAISLEFRDVDGTRWEGFATASYLAVTADGAILQPYLEGLALCDPPRNAPGSDEPLDVTPQDPPSRPGANGPTTNTPDAAVPDAPWLGGDEPVANGTSTDVGEE